jgi:hypothetical protein
MTKGEEEKEKDFFSLFLSFSLSLFHRRLSRFFTLYYCEATCIFCFGEERPVAISIFWLNSLSQSTSTYKVLAQEG